MCKPKYTYFWNYVFGVMHLIDLIFLGDLINLGSSVSDVNFEAHILADSRHGPSVDATELDIGDGHGA